MNILDTSAIIELLYKTEKGQEIYSEIAGSEIATTTICLFQFLIGEKTEDNISVIRRLPLVQFSEKEAVISAELQRNQFLAGQPLSETDAMIAGICMTNNATLITCDKDFKRVKKLKVKVF